MEMNEARFVGHLRAVTERYLQAVDAWEEAYSKYYRLAAFNRISPDVEPFHQEYLRVRNELNRCLPRARQLCMKHGIRDPWQAMLQIELGARAPQQGASPAIGRGERNLIADCMAELEAAVHIPEAAPVAPQPHAAQSGLLKRIFDYFF